MFPLILKNPYRSIIDGIHILGFLSSNGSYFYKVDSTTYDLFSHRLYRNEEELYKQLALHKKEDINRALQLVKRNPNLLATISDDYIKMKETSIVTKLTLNLTYMCNLACEYCFEGINTRINKAMDENTAERAVEWFKEQLGNKEGTIIFTGGEPLMNISLIKKVVQLTSMNDNIQYLIKTNGSLITDSILDFLVKNDICLSFSLDGNKNVNDTHRKKKNGYGSYNQVYNVLEVIKRNYPDYLKLISINAVVTNKTITFIKDAYSFIDSLGVNSYSIKPVMHKKLNLDEKAIKEYVSNYYWPALIRRKNTSNINICGIGHEHICIDYDGTIYPCYRLCGKTDFIIGNIYDNNVCLRKVKRLESIYERETSYKCYNCYAKAVCVTGCFADKLEYENCYEDTSIALFDGVIKHDLLMDNKYKLLPILS